MLTHYFLLKEHVQMVFDCLFLSMGSGDETDSRATVLAHGTECSIDEGMLNIQF